MAKLGLLAGPRSTPEEIRRLKEREIFALLALLAALFGLALSIFAGYVAWIAYHLQDASVILAVVAFVLALIGIIGVYAARSENYIFMYIYIYGVILMIPIILLLAVGCFSFHDTLSGFVDHSWDRHDVMELRDLFCESGTAESTCRAPVHGGRDFNSTLSWCLAGCPYQGHNDNNLLCAPESNECKDVVDAAQADAHRWLTSCFRIMGIGCLANALLLIAGISCAVRLITVPIVMKTLLSVINMESFFPVVLSVTAGVWSFKHSFLVAELDWIAVVFIAVGALCLLLALLGSYAGKHKHRTGLAVYMGGVGVVLVGCVVLCTACWMLTGTLDNHMDHKSDEDVQSIPCDAGLHGCCCCGDDNFDEECPEWSRHDITEFIRMCLKMLGFIPFFLFFFMGIGLLGAMAWHSSLEQYQSEQI